MLMPSFLFLESCAVCVQHQFQYPHLDTHKQKPETWNKIKCSLAMVLYHEEKKIVDISEKHFIMCFGSSSSTALPNALATRFQFIEFLSKCWRQVEMLRKMSSDSSETLKDFRKQLINFKHEPGMIIVSSLSYN